MKGRLLSCIIFTFLFATFSASGQSQALKAVECERLVFEGAGPWEANGALLERARCLVSLERWNDALDALERLRMYALDKEIFPEVCYMKALCKHGVGDTDGAYAALKEGQEQGYWTLSVQEPKLKSPLAAIILSAFTPFGHMYVGSRKGFTVGLVSAASAAFAIWQAFEGCWITAFLGGGSLLAMSYMRENLQLVPSLAEKYNAQARQNFLKEQLDVLDF